MKESSLKNHGDGLFRSPAKGWRFILICAAWLLCAGISAATDFRLQSGQPLPVFCADVRTPVVQTALKLLARDYRAVFSDTLLRTPSPEAARLLVLTQTQGGDGALKAYPEVERQLAGLSQAFVLQVRPDGRLLIAGSDPHGTAYGMMELSRLMGVSPWEWWADATPRPLKEWRLPSGYTRTEHPSVPFRGFFINDEDWGMMPWSSKNYEPEGVKGRIGPKTNARIFELMLRLRANYYWPAMHECTHPFFLTPGNREMAERYGIYVGGSHCEPMASSTAVEWRLRGKGAYNFVTNAREVEHFWEQRVKEVARQEIVYTLGMRGVHDGRMQGANSVEEQKKVLQTVIDTQRRMLKKWVNPDLSRVPQVFIPYKEVLDVYHAGLDVPDDVALMWCDDNYGYIRHFPTPAERKRSGGNGIYYHVSYWGRPHDYLWLGTFSPYLLHQQMQMAYDKGIRKMWILNVGDIKPAEYQLELFMDMAWNIRRVTQEGVDAHLLQFLTREFGAKAGRALLPVMQEHYRLAYIRKPEFMGNTREEEPHNPQARTVKDLPWSYNEIRQRLESYGRLSDRAERWGTRMQPNRRDTYFQLVQYPVQAAAQMNRKILYAQLVRHGKADAEACTAAYDSIVALTRRYNLGTDGSGKWNRIMDHRPRKLPVFEPLSPTLPGTPVPACPEPLLRLQPARDGKGLIRVIEGLGYDRASVAVDRGGDLQIEFGKLPQGVGDSVRVEVRLLPLHPVDGDSLRFSLQLDGAVTPPIDYHTRGRSEEWKENVLRNQAIRSRVFPVVPGRKHRLTLRALDEGVVVDQILIYPSGSK